MKIKRYLMHLLLILIVNVINAQHSNLEPERIILNLTEEPSNSMSVTWRTLDMAESPKAQITVARDWTDLEEFAEMENAETEEVYPHTDSAWYSYSVTFAGLKPNTTYAYRVGDKDNWSEWNQFNTASNSNDPFSFVFFGDPQNDIKMHCSRIFRKAFKVAPDAGFWMFAGDIVTDPIDSLWEELFYAAGFIFRSTPSIMIPGNHDHNWNWVDGKKTRTNKIGDIWGASFTLPQNGIEGLEELSYHIDYQNVRFVMLESQTRIEEQLVWLETLLADNPNKWTVLMFHYPIYSSGRNKDNKVMHKFLPLIDKYNVDLVLTGHDHVYSRSYKLRNGKRVASSENGTVFMVSVSGSKAYPLTPLHKDIMAKTGENIQLFQVFNVDGSKLTCRVYTAAGRIYDSFELEK